MARPICKNDVRAGGVDVVVFEKVVAGNTMSAIAAVSVETARAQTKRSSRAKPCRTRPVAGETTIGFVFWMKAR
jgi:hypothetical protein